MLAEAGFEYVPSYRLAFLGMGLPDDLFCRFEYNLVMVEVSWKLHWPRFERFERIGQSVEAGIIVCCQGLQVDILPGG
jgi:hypothetical protein